MHSTLVSDSERNDVQKVGYRAADTKSDPDTLSQGVYVSSLLF